MSFFGHTCDLPWMQRPMGPCPACKYAREMQELSERAEKLPPRETYNANTGGIMQAPAPLTPDAAPVRPPASDAPAPPRSLTPDEQRDYTTAISATARPVGAAPQEATPCCHSADRNPLTGAWSCSTHRAPQEATAAPEPLQTLRAMLTGVNCYQTMPPVLDAALHAVEATVAALTTERDARTERDRQVYRWALEIQQTARAARATWRNPSMTPESRDDALDQIMDRLGDEGEKLHDALMSPQPAARLRAGAPAP